jgi:hypothetical protein
VPIKIDFQLKSIAIIMAMVMPFYFFHFLKIMAMVIGKSPKKPIKND